METLLNAAPCFLAEFDDEILRLSDTLCVNETEAAELTKSATGTLDEAKRAVQLLLTKGPQCVIITLGENGALYGFRGDDDVQHVEARKTRAVDTTVSVDTADTAAR